MEEKTMNEKQGQEAELELEEGKTFTKEDVSRIVRDRLAKEKAKAAKTLEAREAELTRRELRMTARERFAENEIPVELVDVISYSDDEQLDNAIELLKEALKGSGSKKEMKYDPVVGSAHYKDPVDTAMGL